MTTTTTVLLGRRRDIIEWAFHHHHQLCDGRLTDVTVSFWTQPPRSYLRVLVVVLLRMVHLCR